MMRRKVVTTPTARACQTASLLLILVMVARHACGGHRAQRSRAGCSTRGDMPAQFVLVPWLAEHKQATLAERSLP